MIMKQATIAVFILCLFTACNNEKKKQPEKPVVTNAAEKEMQDAIAKFPDSLLLRENLIQYYRDNGTYDMAISATDTALKRSPGNARLWDIKGTLQFENEDTLNAIKSFEKAIEFFPDPQYMMSLGTLYAQTKNAKALDMADALLRSKKTADKEALFIKGLYFTYIGDKQKAIVFFDNCLALDYTFMFAYREKAIALYDLHKYEEALKVLDKAVTLQNNFDEGYYWKGRCLEKMNRVNDAIESYRTALLYDPEYVEAQDALAKLGVK